jgi:hypothetical protein
LTATHQVGEPRIIAQRVEDRFHFQKPQLPGSRFESIFVILNESGDASSGPFVVRIYLPDGTLVFTGNGTASATRIQ